MDKIAQQGAWFHLRCAFVCVASGLFKQKPLIHEVGQSSGDATAQRAWKGSPYPKDVRGCMDPAWRLPTSLKEYANHFGLKNRRPQNNTAESVAMHCENMMGMHGLWWAFLIATALAAVFVVWRFGAGAMWRNQPRETAHEILRRRLGSGDINAEEYEKRKALLDRDN